MKIYDFKSASGRTINKLFSRPAIDPEKSFGAVRPILEEIKMNGLTSALYYAKKFDNYTAKNIKASESEFEAAEKKLSLAVKKAIKSAYANIKKFHSKQIPNSYTVKTMEGVVCSREFRPIENVGLYIPGGTSVLPSTMLMLAIPAKLAGAKRIIACSPVKGNEVNPAVLYAAKICGVDEFYKIGGAQAIALMAYGDKKIKKVEKIFGPGNQYVTAAKMLVSLDPSGCAIDMPAGPSEVLVIADESADPSFVAADLLSQAEHGPDSQVILLTDSRNTAESVNAEVAEQLKYSPRKEYIMKSLSHSFIMITPDIESAVKLSNTYAPEHLILNIKNADRFRKKINNAGSVFIGNYSPESVGDYASGTNHSLPTYGYAKSYSGVSVESFMKAVTFQKLSREGLNKIADTVVTLAEVEGLEAHANAVKIRRKK